MSAHAPHLSGPSRATNSVGPTVPRRDRDLAGALRLLADRIRSDEKRVHDRGGQRVTQRLTDEPPGGAGEDPHRDPLSTARARLVDLHNDPATAALYDIVSYLLEVYYGKRLTR